MTRLVLAVAVSAFVSSAFAAEPPTAVLEATVQANRLLGQGRAREAVAVLEKRLADADGDAPFLSALRAAYTAEIKESSDAAAVERTRAKLAALGAPSVSEPAETVDLLKRAGALFTQATGGEPAKFLSARDLYDLAVKSQVRMTADQTASWSLCRVKVAADRLANSSDATTAQQMEREATEAMAQAPDNVELQKSGREVLVAARKRIGTAPPTVEITKTVVVAETASFRIVGAIDKAAAEKLAESAEVQRAAIFARWSGPPGGAWNPKCEIVIHATAEAFAKETKRPVSAPGRTEVTVADGRPTSRRIDLRADAADSAMPCEVAHAVLADLFPNQRPPCWAEIGMAVLAGGEAEVGRYLRTLPKIEGKKWIPAAKLAAAVEVPADNVTAFHVQSVSLLDFLVRWQGEKAFTAFLRDAQRYGVEPALKRQYGVKDFVQLEQEWRKNVLE